MPPSFRHAFGAALFAALAAPAVFAQPAAPAATASAPEAGEVSPPPNLPPIPLFDSFERATGIKLFGLLQLGYSSNDVSTHDQASVGHSNLPIVGPADEGLQLNALQVVLQKQMRSNILPRISPLPVPMPADVSWGFRVETLYGRNGLPAQMHGIETEWGFDRSPAGSPPGTTRQSYFALPQVYGEIYLPVWQGAALTIGRFGAGIGREIAPEFSPGPNFFYSRTYAFVSQPDQIFGALASVNLMHNGSGLLSGEAGIAQGRQSFRDNNPQKSVVGALRWRSPDMKSWLDYSFMIGDEQNSPDGAPQLPQARVISPRGQLRQHHSVAVDLHPSFRWELVGEVLYGRQAGDGGADTVDVFTGPGYRGGRYAGVNAEARYRLSEPLRLAVRGEWFVDRQATALFPVTLAAGDFHAVTAGAPLRHQPQHRLAARGAIRLADAQPRHEHAFGGGSASRQTTLSADVVMSF